jgi:hypothetical protein
MRTIGCFSQKSNFWHVKLELRRRLGGGAAKRDSDAKATGDQGDNQHDFRLRSVYHTLTVNTASGHFIYRTNSRYDWLHMKHALNCHRMSAYEARSTPPTCPTTLRKLKSTIDTSPTNTDADVRSMISDFFYPQPGGVESHIYQLSSVCDSVNMAFCQTTGGSYACTKLTTLETN